MTLQEALKQLEDFSTAKVEYIGTIFGGEGLCIDINLDDIDEIIKFHKYLSDYIKAYLEENKF